MSEEETTAIAVHSGGMITPAGTVDEAVAAFEDYQQLKGKLGSREDFTRIGSKAHPNKSFVRKVQRYFGISCSLVQDEPLKNEAGDIIGWLCAARAVHSVTGHYQEGDGSCEMSEKNPNQRTVHNVRAHAVTRAKNRAIMDLVGFGDVTADEIEQAEAAGTESPYYCTEHSTVWFKRGRMRNYAHPVGEDGPWCDMPSVTAAPKPAETATDADFEDLGVPRGAPPPSAIGPRTFEDHGQLNAAAHTELHMSATRVREVMGVEKTTDIDISDGETWERLRQSVEAPA